MADAKNTADKDAAKATEAAVEQGNFVAETDANGAVQGYLGKDAADLHAEAKDSDAVTTAGVVPPRKVPAADYREPVPPGGHPADPTSTTSVGSAADDGTAVAKADASRL